MKIDINGVSITLTKEQLKKIAKQTSNIVTIDNIDYKSALELLKDNNIDPDPKGLFSNKLLQLMTIIKACNFLDNNDKEWKADFTKDYYKYLPWFKKENSSWGGLLRCWLLL